MACKGMGAFVLLLVGVAAPGFVEAAGRRISSGDGLGVQRANLRVDGVQVMPSPVVVGVPFRVSFRVVNDGAGVARNFVVRVTHEGQEAPFTVLVPTLAGGGKAQLASMLRATEVGPCRVVVSADATGVVPETNEKDNGRVLVVDVLSRERPELRIRSMVMEPSAPAPGSTVRLKAIVENVGTVPSTPCLAEIRVADEASAAPLAVPALPAAGRASVERSLAIGARTSLAVTARVDIGGMVAERDETNNARSMVFQLGNRPDLVFATVRAQPTSPDAGGRVRVMAWIRNGGTVAAGRFAVDFVRSDGQKTARAWCDSLAAGATVRSQVLLSELKEGVLTVKVRLDPTGAVAESNESNNALPLTLRVGAKPVAATRGRTGRRR